MLRVYSEIRERIGIQHTSCWERRVRQLHLSERWIWLYRCCQKWRRNEDAHLTRVQSAQQRGDVEWRWMHGKAKNQDVRSPDTVYDVLAAPKRIHYAQNCTEPTVSPAWDCRWARTDQFPTSKIFRGTLAPKWQARDIVDQMILSDNGATCKMLQNTCTRSTLVWDQ